ncbi:MAG: alpha-amylase family glycosyl hydrolase [Candidatus Izemoplasmatales bacterium]|nr:alpha-amylase family glycosyl hydrolase [Candidatus Izemoplasmatales bacterium]
MKKTSTKLRNLVIYQIYVRNFSKEGNFQAIIDDLDRIKSLGVDVIYLLPIHPIGEKNKKGSLGCPYSIRDYNKVDEDLGGLSEFKRLLEEAHGKKLKVMMDIVFNHTSRDSVLLKDHPEWFYHNEQGVIANRVGDWWDVVDLDYSKSKNLWFELLNVLVYYARMGVDGYRCDVASMVPIDFWKLARKQVKKVNPKFMWLSESVHGGHCKYLRDQGFECASESEIYQAFDMAYDYDIEPYMQGFLHGESTLKPYLEGLKRQDEIYPENYIKMHNIENHDIERIAKQVDGNISKIKNWNAFMFMQKGAAMLYMGQEYAADIKPSLFDKELYNKNTDLTEFVTKLVKLKKRKIFASGIYSINIPEVDGVAYQTFADQIEEYHGIFNVGLSTGFIKTNLPDGKYRNYLTNKYVTVKDSLVKLSEDPIIIKFRK